MFHRLIKTLQRKALSLCKITLTKSNSCFVYRDESYRFYQCLSQLGILCATTHSFSEKAVRREETCNEQAPLNTVFSICLFLLFHTAFGLEQVGPYHIRATSEWGLTWKLSLQVGLRV